MMSPERELRPAVSGCAPGPNEQALNERLGPIAYRELFVAREFLRPPPGWELGVYPKGRGRAAERPVKALRFRLNRVSCFL